MLNVFARNHSESPKHAPVRPLHAPISPLARAESHPCASVAARDSVRHTSHTAGRRSTGSWSLRARYDSKFAPHREHDRRFRFGFRKCYTTPTPPGGRFIACQQCGCVTRPERAGLPLKSGRRAHPPGAEGDSNPPPIHPPPSAPLTPPLCRLRRLSLSRFSLLPFLCMLGGARGGVSHRLV